MLRRMILSALAAGCAAGIAAAVLQHARTLPLIAQAEVYEAAAASQHREHDHATAGTSAPNDAPGDQAWEPAPGLERLAYTVLADVLAGIGYALILSGILAVYTRLGGKLDLRRGVLWGLGGFAAVALAPALGLPPELPGTMAAALADRQAWWVGTALATACGLALLVFAKRPVAKAAGGVLLLVPHLVGAPHPLEEGGSAPAALAAEFAVASLVSAAVFWAVLGGMSGWLHGRFTAVR